MLRLSITSLFTSTFLSYDSGKVVRTALTKRSQLLIPTIFDSVFIAFQLDNEESVVYEDDMDEYNMIHVPI